MTSGDGVFTLTPQLGTFALVAAHDRGIGSTFGDSTHSPATIQLRPLDQSAWRHR